MSSLNKKSGSGALSASDLVVLQDGIETLQVELNARQREQLFQYGQLIQKWNRVYNLTAIRDGRELITHHLLDSLAVVSNIFFAAHKKYWRPLQGSQADGRELITHHLLDSLAVVSNISCALHKKSQSSILDVGAGAGLPGLVLAIAKPEWHITLIDTVQKKAAFMQQAIASLGLKNAQAVHGRVEEYKPDQAFDLICSRAFSSIDNFIALSQHALSAEGVFAALKGRVEVDSEVPTGWRIEALHPIQVPFLDEARHLFLIKR